MRSQSPLGRGVQPGGVAWRAAACEGPLGSELLAPSCSGHPRSCGPLLAKPSGLAAPAVFMPSAIP